MSQVADVDVKQVVLSNSTFGPQEIRQLTNSIARDFSNYRALREAVQELESKEEHSPASKVRLGVCQYLLGRYRRAIETLSSSDGGALARFYQGKANFALQDYPAAVESYKQAAQAGYDKDLCVLAQAEAQRYAGDPKKALGTLDHLSGAVESSAEYLYQRGATISALGGNPSEVVALLERAVETDPNHTGALFGLA